MAEENKNRKNIWKISHGKLKPREAKAALEKQVVTIGFDEIDTLDQKGDFTNKAQTGDFFYLSNVNCGDGKHSVQLLGQFKGEAEPSEIEGGWIQRPYKLIASAINYNYTGPKKGWTPNYNRTVYMVQPEDHQLFEERILTRNFNLKLEDLYKYENDDFNEEKNQIRENESGHVTIDDSTYQTFKNKDNDIKNYSHNRIFFGAPGTGKSYMLNQEKDALLENSGEYERVTFHPDYSYANFVGTYKPVNDENGEIKYEYVPGPFMRTFVKAMKNAIEVQDEVEDPQPYLLIIEEINRADVAAVFGDIFQLLDRDDDNVSEYSIETSEDMRKYLSKELNVNLSDCEKIKIPDNMFIWATMNSADQGVFPMDTAFKRRWDFEYIGIDSNESKINDIDVTLKLTNGNTQTFNWNELRHAINDFLANNNINEDKQLGPYFISRKTLESKTKIDDIEYNIAFQNAFKDKVIMYLFEDAAKQKRSNLFTSNRYSKICNAFDEDGISGAFKEDTDNTNGIYVDVKTYPSPSNENSEEGESGRQASTTETTDNSDVNQD